MPSSPFENTPANGTIENTRNAGTNDKYGASRKMRRSARSGINGSLKNNLMPSASVWRIPHGPARFGPMRFCMSPMTLRSNHTINIVAISKKTKTATTLMTTTTTTLADSPEANNGSIRRPRP